MAFPGQHWEALASSVEHESKAISKLKSDYAEYPAFGANFLEAKHKMLPMYVSPNGQGVIYIKKSDL